MLAQVRQFFVEREVMEVDCPAINCGAAVDAHIDLMQVYSKTLDAKFYLHSSPELLMKRLLAEGLGDIYQLSHVFRDGEVGVMHNPEFMMIEWYRLGFSLDQMIEETAACLRLFLGDLPLEKISYREAFERFLRFDPFSVTIDFLKNFLRDHQMRHTIEGDDRDNYLNLILGLFIEPKLGKDQFLALYDYPASQAALSQIEGEVAKRFEIYYQGKELANGYQELTSGEEAEKRFHHANSQRESLGKAIYPIDKTFVKKDLPACCGVAVGFDRLLMLQLKMTKIEDVMPQSWDKL